MSRRPAQPFLLFLFGGLLLATALPTDAATLTLSQQPLFLTEGVAPNIMAMKMGRVASGQSVKPMASAVSGTASATTR